MSEDLTKRLRDLGDHAAYEPHMHHAAADQIDDLKREIQDLHRQVNYWRSSAEHWRDMWGKASNRLLQVDPEFNRTTFVTVPDKINALRDAVWRDDD
jgi:hypothetical protein